MFTSRSDRGRPSVTRYPREAVTETQLCETFLPLLRAFGRRHLRDNAAAEELAQESLFLALEALHAHRIGSETPLGAYVLGIARNLVREGIRADRRRRALDVQLAPFEGVADAPHVELDQHLRVCISRLTSTARAVLVRAVVEEETGPEIAEALGITPTNVRVIRHRALAEVRRCLQDGELRA